MSVQTETVHMGQIEPENQSIPTSHDCLIELNEFIHPANLVLKSKSSSRGLSQDIFRLTQLLCNKVYDNDHILEIYKYKSNKDSNCIEKDDLEDIYTVIEENAIESKRLNQIVNEIMTHKTPRPNKRQLQNSDNTQKSKQFRNDNTESGNNLNSNSKNLNRPKPQQGKKSLKSFDSSNPELPNKDLLDDKKGDVFKVTGPKKQKQKKSKTDSYLKNSGQGQNIGFDACERKIIFDRDKINDKSLWPRGTLINRYHHHYIQKAQQEVNNQMDIAPQASSSSQ
ncbi:unnamed protein product [Brachionus calyciflorus]|uniref:Uncharacterized protein n=1 Tax=Brachionus calyciflorus TaxID=104777 RepID=A0A814EEC7_9BILA|nr:unnamed protein product [Brachionus calyciflorus]